MYSESISSREDLLIGSSKSISKNYLEIISKLKKTQISEPIKINNNIVIIKLNDKEFKSNNLDLVEIEKK